MTRITNGKEERIAKVPTYSSIKKLLEGRYKWK